MKNMKISAKLILSFSIVSIIMAIVGVVGIIGLKTIDNAYTLAYEQQSAPIPDMAKILEYSQRMRVQLRNCVLYTGQPEKLEAVVKDVNDRIDAFEKYLAAYDATIVNPEARRLFDDGKDKYNNVFKPVVLECVKEAQAGKPQSEILATMDTATEATNSMVDSFTKCMEIKINAAEVDQDQNTDTANFTLTIMIVVVALGVIVAMILGLYISRIISTPVKMLSGLMDDLAGTGNFYIDDASAANVEKYSHYKDETGVTVNSFSKLLKTLLVKCNILESVAGGDLTTNVVRSSENDTMGNALQTMVDNLNKMFSEINSSSNQVSTGSVQIADGAQLLAQGATEQSATVEELSASVAEISAQTKENARMANETKELGESIKTSAEKGNRQMDQMMQAVKEINEASQSIGKVIKIIDDIAFQTNILALNAAVEAARAGQHGKGFAVVADEVRSLAAKSAEAAKNTNELIESSIVKAEQGAAISEETSKSLHQIVEGILRSSEMVASIATSSDEQSSAISQISEAIDQVSQVVQQNSATAEESAAASEEMSGQATLLQQLIGQFKLKDSPMSGLTGSASGLASKSPARVSAPSSTGFSVSDGGKY